MNELHLLYAFLGLMTFNLLATLVYLVGLNPVKAGVKKKTP